MQRPDFDVAAFAARLDASDLTGLFAEWGFWGRLDQDEPPGDWRNWVMLAGRGFGKTRTGAEWVSAQVAKRAEPLRIALIGATERDVRAVMIEGDSGLLSVGRADQRPMWEAVRGRLLWPSGAQAYAYSAESPERLRGPQFDFAWADEVAAWASGAAWDNMQLALRLGPRPRALATTTPRTTPFVRRLVAAPATVVTRGRTTDNRALSRHYMAAMLAEHGGTRFGRQELDGELIDDFAGALWTRTLIEACRVRTLPPVRRVVVGVDPPASSGGDACGIVVAALGIVLLAINFNDWVGTRVFYVTGSSSRGVEGFLPVLIDALQHLILPTTALVLIGYAGTHFLQRSLLLDNIKADYVRTARAKGLTKPQAIRRHALRTSLIPVATQVAFTIPTVFTGAVLTETIFAWNGMGRYFIETISGNDIHGTVAIAAFGAFLTAIGALLADVAVVVLDPRVRVT